MMLLVFLGLIGNNVFGLFCLTTVAVAAAGVGVAVLISLASATTVLCWWW
jgi:urea transporter